VFEVDNVLAGVIPVGDDRCRFDYKKLENAIKAVVKDRLKDENAVMVDYSSDKVPTFVVATKGLHADAPPTLFRSYQCKDHDASECTIWEAGRATSAAPTFFKPIEIGRGVFVDGGLAHNNPGELALAEAQKMWKTTKLFCLVSVGTGRLASIQVVNPDSGSSASAELEKSKSKSSFKIGTKFIRWMPGANAASKAVNAPMGLSRLKDIGKVCMKLSTDSEHVHLRLQARSDAHSEEQPLRYHRLNVERGMDAIGLEEDEIAVRDAGGDFEPAASRDELCSRAQAGAAIQPHRAVLNMRLPAPRARGVEHQRAGSEDIQRIGTGSGGKAAVHGPNVALLDGWEEDSDGNRPRHRNVSTVVGLAQRAAVKRDGID
jgi:hypothetical protein